VNRLGFGAKRTMQVAQGLYEGVDLGKGRGPGRSHHVHAHGLDPNGSRGDRGGTRHIGRRYGASFVPAEPNVFKSKKGAQDAHEAIRPTSLELSPAKVRKHLKDEQFKLYKLIWNRFVASQMKDAVYDQTTAEIDVEPPRAGRPMGSVRAAESSSSPGGSRPTRSTTRPSPPCDRPRSRRRAYRRRRRANPPPGPPPRGRPPYFPSRRRRDPPGAVEGEKLVLSDPPGVVTEQKFTQPPPRYTEGSLVRELEERGIGRPSTYAEIISKVQARDYVEKSTAGGSSARRRSASSSSTGSSKSKLDFMDPAFTSGMEEQLDAGRGRDEDRVALLSRFYKRFRGAARPRRRRASAGTPSPSRPTRSATRAAPGR
jgi:DNA topoisomerase-1